MNTSLQSRLDLFVRNAHAVKKAFFWKNDMIKRLAALLYAAENKAVDIQAVHNGEKLIKENTGMFSSFRGNSFLSVAALLSLANSPDILLSDTLTTYDLLKDERFKSSDYLAVAACFIAARAEAGRTGPAVIRAKAYFDGIKGEHRFITGPDDCLFAALFGLSGLDVQTGLERTESFYNSLKHGFHGLNHIQSLAQVLALSGNETDLPARVRSLNDAFRAEGLKMGQGYAMASLGVLSLLPQNPGPMAREVRETCDYLRRQSGFGQWSVSKQELLLIASALYAFEAADGIGKNLMTATVSASIAGIVIMQQTAIAIAAASAATTAASSSASN